MLDALLRAGRFGTLRGGHPGWPHLGLCVPVMTPQELQHTQARLAGLGIRATLLIGPELIQMAAALRQAARAGHQLAGHGPVGKWPLLLELAVGEALSAYALDAPTWKEARRLHTLGTSLLPPPAPQPEPGAVMRLRPAELEKVREWQALGYQVGPVSELPGLRLASGRDLAIWLYQQQVDARFARAHGVAATSQRADALLRLAAVPAPPGLPLPAGTPAAELHLNSARLVGLAERGSLRAYRAFSRSLRDVAGMLNTRPDFADAELVFAVSLFWGTLERHGFHLAELGAARSRLYGAGFHGFKLLYGTRADLAAPKAGVAWMERRAFLERFGSAGLTD